MVRRWGTVRSAHEGCIEAPDERWGMAMTTPFAKRRSSRMDVSDEGRAPRTRRSRSPFPWIEIDCGRDGASRSSSSAVSGEAAARWERRGAATGRQGCVGGGVRRQRRPRLGRQRRDGKGVARGRRIGARGSASNGGGVWIGARGAGETKVGGRRTTGEGGDVRRGNDERKKSDP
ncbi:hypothetical protein PVAP13_7KG064387 [Panicum virgatum]|uniref:Uncharacterized protein n=1 Tax=Panicum virgatum TaxID=38727 RepID=A0A8T0QCF6_PANVG|nr:hypothetical protein PVAP13_7KG064387 [Panicum virgatum]